ncbi:VanW family protein [Glutamicibacter sp. AOP12-B1-11]|uniref:VanW family protein n=1 Tax=Glutamicibacter sp. AOP12-B1-11 TaxID=3457725 RepID=UPI0040341C05
MQTPSPDSSSSPSARNGSKGKAKSKAKPWIITGSCVVAAAALYFGGAAFVSAQIPANTSIAGVNIGSMSQDEARAALSESVAPLAEEPFEVLVNAQSYKIDPAKAGLTLNIDDTVADLTGYEANPADLLDRLTGKYTATASIDVDNDKLNTELQALAKKANAEVAEGDVTFAEGKATLVAPVDGVVLKQDEAASLLSEEWRIGAAGIELPSEVTKPEISPDALQSFYDDQVKSLLKDKVTLTSDQKKVDISTASIAAAASYTPKDGAPAITLDDKKLFNAATKNSELSSTAKNARITLANGKPTIKKSVPGVALETKGLGAKVLAATETKERTAKVVLSASEADFTTEDAKKLGIKEEIVEFSTPYPANDTVRTKNLRAGSARINGTVIEPGENFSLLEALGPITVANGYFGSGVVVDGFSTEAVGGGLSQISTQLYNVGFLAGYDDVTHKPHSRWFERYPAGREATLWEGSVDMIWKNNSPYGVMIQAWVSGDRVHTRLWSTDYWKVSQKSSGKYNQTNPEIKYNTAKECVSESGGQKGFTIDITRNRTTVDGSKTLPPDVKSWTYQPWHKVVCGEKP